jgi:anaerobic selenocysteine-containing dehydrogenase
MPNSKVAWTELIADYDRIRDLIERTVPGFEAFNERIRHPGGFRLPLPPTERQWHTPSGKAIFSVYDGVKEDADVLGAENVLRLITIRSHDQYNTTIYAMDDRYRGVFGRRDVLFMNESDLAEHGLEHGDLVDIETIVSGRQLRLKNITAIVYAIAKGSVAAYYPEANVLVPLDYIDKECGTPSYKSVPVKVTRAAAS